MTDTQSTKWQYVTGYGAGVGGATQIKIALEVMREKPDGIAELPELYSAVEEVMQRRNPAYRLSEEGQASFRYSMNHVAADAGYVKTLGYGRWQITSGGKEYIDSILPVLGKEQTQDNGLHHTPTAWNEIQYVTGYSAGFSGDDQIKIALGVMSKTPDGIADLQELYAAVEDMMQRRNPAYRLSEEGKASFRYFLNKVATDAGYVNSLGNGRWQVTPRGREYIASILAVSGKKQAQGNGLHHPPTAWDDSTPLDQRPLGWSIGQRITHDDWVRLRPEERRLRNQEASYYLNALEEEGDADEQHETFEVLRKAFNL